MIPASDPTKENCVYIYICVFLCYYCFFVKRQREDVSRHAQQNPENDRLQVICYCSGLVSVPTRAFGIIIFGFEADVYFIFVVWKATCLGYSVMCMYIASRVQSMVQSRKKNAYVATNIFLTCV